MKNSEIAAIILIAAFSAVVAYFSFNYLLGDPYDQVVKVQYMEKINNRLVDPDSEIFNEDAINPTEEIEIGN